MTRLKVTHVLASIDDPGAGPSYSAMRLASALAREGADVTLRSVSGWRDNGAAWKRDDVDGTVRLLRSPLDGGQLARLMCSSQMLRQALGNDAGNVDILHTHGLWLMPNVYPSWAANQPGARALVVLSPRGMLGDPALAFSRLKKRLFWRLIQSRAISKVSVLHATSEAELSDIRSFGLKTPVALIPNGVDLPDLKLPTIRAPEILYLGRVHPKKGIDILIQAWALVANLRPGWRVRIVGPTEGYYDRELKQLVARLRVPRVSIEGPAYGAVRLTAYRTASLLALPTRNENFAMVVAEALAAELPVVASRGAPWQGLERERCGWWVDHGIEPLAAAIEEATSIGSQCLAEMGARGRAWMARDFAWSRIAGNMLDVYQWLAGGRSAPSTIAFA